MPSSCARRMPMRASGPIDKSGSARSAGRAGGADRRRLSRRRARPDPAQCRPDGAARCRRARCAASSRSRPRISRCRPTRCGLSASRSRWSSPRRIAAAKDAAELLDIAYEPLPAVARAVDALQPGAPRLWHGRAGQSLHRYRGRRRGRDRSGFRASRACRPARHLDAARHRRADGAAHDDRRLRRGDAGTTRSIPAAAAASPSCAIDLAQVLGVPAEQVRVVLRRHGRQFRHAQFLLSRIRAAAWAARRVGRPVKWTCERQRSLSERLSGPRSDRRGRTGARRGREISSPCAASTSAISAVMPRPSCRCRRASA